MGALVKKPAAVANAEAVAAAKKATLDAARKVVQGLEAEWRQALDAVKAARVEADNALPQCGLVRTKWPSGEATDAGRVVIVRRTPAGRLVVRRAGSDNPTPWLFKWDARAGVFREVTAARWPRELLELRDVPSEYLPNASS